MEALKELVLQNFIENLLNLVKKIKILKNKYILS